MENESATMLEFIQELKTSPEYECMHSLETRRSFDLMGTGYIW
jgi:hypothetical protein